MTTLYHQTAGGPLFQAVLPRTAAAGCHAAAADCIAGDFLLLYCTCAHSDHLLSPVLTAGGPLSEAAMPHAAPAGLPAAAAECMFHCTCAVLYCSAAGRL